MAFLPSFRSLPRVRKLASRACFLLAAAFALLPVFVMAWQWYACQSAWASAYACLVEAFFVQLYLWPEFLAQSAALLSAVLFALGALLEAVPGGRLNRL